MNRFLDYLILKLSSLRIKLLSPHEGDVVFIQCEQLEQAKKMAHEIVKSKCMQGVGLIVLQDMCKLDNLKDMPESMKERIREAL